MKEKYNKTILTVLMKWDYCDEKRGFSYEKHCFFDNFSKLVDRVEPFWYDEYINNIPKLRRELLKKCEEVNPDLIFFIPYSNQFDTKTLDVLKKNWKTCVWFGDDTWRFESFSSKLAKSFSYICTTDIFRMQDYRKLGVEPILTQWGAQSLQNLEKIPLDIEYEYEVSFVGAKNRVRQWFVNKLRGYGIKANCFGSGWPSGKISFEKMEEIFLKTKINLNLSNTVSSDITYVFGGLKNFATYFVSPKKSEQIKARNFEIPLAGGFQLTNYVPGLEQYLKIGEEVAVFNSYEECAQQIKHYLENEAERKCIMLAGHQRVKNEHTYQHRFKKILEDIWK